jgi:hypothetical protein
MVNNACNRAHLENKGYWFRQQAMKMVILRSEWPRNMESTYGID